MLGIKSWINLNSSSVFFKGTRIATDAYGKDLLVSLYRKYINGYPKFFKMDPLSRLGFVACELLFNSEKVETLQTDNLNEDSCLILFNKSASLANDKIYNETIDHENYFPSPSVFVYTLPNIVTGEIAIKNKIYGETSFYVIDELDATTIFNVVSSSMSDTNNNRCICGWLECSNEDNFNAILLMIDKTSDTLFNIENLRNILNYK